MNVRRMKDDTPPLHEAEALGKGSADRRSLMQLDRGPFRQCPALPIRDADVASTPSRAGWPRMTDPQRYVLDGDTPIPWADLEAWTRWYHTADRVIARTTVADVVDVITVFLGVDHRPDGG